MLNCIFQHCKVIVFDPRLTFLLHSRCILVGPQSMHTSPSYHILPHAYSFTSLHTLPARVPMCFLPPLPPRTSAEGAGEALGESGASAVSGSKSLTHPLERVIECFTSTRSSKPVTLCLLWSRILCSRRDF